MKKIIRMTLVKEKANDNFNICAKELKTMEKDYLQLLWQDVEKNHSFSSRIRNPDL